MTKEVYNFIIDNEIECLNWPPKKNQEEPDLLQFKYKGLCKFTLPKNPTIKDIIHELALYSYTTGFKNGQKSGIQHLQNGLKELIGIK